jgi:tetratricopeptide (TPR) repeat protein
MYSVVTMLRNGCLVALMTGLLVGACGCNKSAKPPKPTESTASHTRPAPGPVREKPSQFWPRRGELAERRIKRLGDPDKWIRILGAGLRGAAEEGEKSLADPLTHMRAGDKALANGQTELSIACFSRAVELDPKNADAHKGLAVATSALAAGQNSVIATRKLYRRAAGTYRTILEISPDDETARFNLGLALMRSGSPTEADSVFRPLLASKKFAAKATFNLAMVLSSQGKLKQAEILLRRLIRKTQNMGPSDLATAHTHLGEVLVDLGDTTGALEAYKEAVRLTPKDVAAWLNLAAAARAHGSYGYAVTATRKAAELSPFNAEIHLRLGNVLLELHRATKEDRFLNQAVAAWRNSLKIDPSQTDLQRRVEIYSRPSPSTQPTPRTKDAGSALIDNVQQFSGLVQENFGSALGQFVGGSESPEHANGEYVGPDSGLHVGRRVAEV